MMETLNNTVSRYVAHVNKASSWLWSLKSDKQRDTVKDIDPILLKKSNILNQEMILSLESEFSIGEKL